MHQTPRVRSVAYSVALLGTVVCLVLRWPLRPVLGDTVAHMTFFPAVMLAAYVGGFWPGLLATFLGAAAANFFIVNQPPAFRFTTVTDVAGLGLFVVVGTITSGLCESLHRARCRILADERQRAAEALSQERYLLHALVDNLPDNIYFKDASSRFLRINKALTTYFGLSYPEEAIGKTDFDFFTEEHAGLAHADEQEILRTGQPMVGKEEKETWLDGRVRWVSTTRMPLRDQAGTIVGTFGVARDITRLKLTEEALRDSERRFRGTFENAAVGIGHVDATGRFLRVNETFCAIVGYSREELLQRTFRDITHPDDQELGGQSFAALLRGEEACYTLEKRYVRKDGSPVQVELFISLQRDETGQPAYAIAALQDISRRKKLEGELRRAIEAAEAANRAKDEFLANVSHEIRTPMNAILGMTELALDTPLTEDQRQRLKTVKSAADNLLVIINDLLDFARIEAGKLELDPADFSLRSAVGDTLRALALRAHTKGLELVCQIQPDVPDDLVGDAGRLRQVLVNLVGNAIKFTDEGEVVVRVEQASGGCQPPVGAHHQQRVDTPRSPDVSLRFTVRDTGIGISPQKQATIFRAFEQEDTSTTRKYGGTGLGLTIASRLAALMGGGITVESEPGQGSTFSFTARFGLQAQPHKTDGQSAPPQVALRDLPVLIVDDNATNRHILVEWLRGWQMKSVAVGDGVAAMDALWHGTACGRPYALVLLDARMPDTDGLVLASHIRQRTELSATRIILLTSGDRPGDVARFREQRVNAHLLKPVQQEELLETIYRVMSRTAEDKVTRWQGDQVTADSPDSLVIVPASQRLRILVAEDNEFNAELLEQLLLRPGHEVQVANNGRKALALAEEGVFDLLLLDVHMPELDGFQVVQAIRERERVTGGHLPVVALTARARKEDRERCLAAGMDDFLAKPIQATDLWAAIDRVAAGRPPVPGPIAVPRRAAAGLLDPRVLLAACGGNGGILEKICQALRDRLPEQLQAVQDALRERDTPRLRETAHKLCGMVGAFSSVAGGVASEVEDCAAEDRLEEARPLVGRLATMAEELLRAVDGLALETLRQQIGSAEALERAGRP